MQHRPISFFMIRSVDAHGTPGHRRGNAEEVLATNRKRVNEGDHTRKGSGTSGKRRCGLMIKFITHTHRRLAET